MLILATDLPLLFRFRRISLACFFWRSRFSVVLAKDATKGRPSDKRATNVRSGGISFLSLSLVR